MKSSDEIALIESFIKSIWELGECTDEDVQYAALLFNRHRELAPEQYED
jgi:hypothetical protein